MDVNLVLIGPNADELAEELMRDLSQPEGEEIQDEEMAEVIRSMFAAIDNPLVEDEGPGAPFEPGDDYLKDQVNRLQTENQRLRRENLEYRQRNAVLEKQLDNLDVRVSGVPYAVKARDVKLCGD